jgi:phage tail sheath protein FI
VVEVPTGVPAFIGYTEFARDGSRDLTGVPTHISTLAEFVTLFGRAPRRRFRRIRTTNHPDAFRAAGQDFYLFNALQLFFNNGGGACWILSVGGYDATTHDASDFAAPVWEALASEPEPAIYVIPDAVALAKTDYKTISEKAMLECQRLGNRVAILDIYDGANPDMDEVISGPAGFRNYLSFGDKPSFGAAYYPWLNTTIVAASEVTFTMLDDPSRGALADDIRNSDDLRDKLAANPSLASMIEKIRTLPASAVDESSTHTTLMAASDVYRQAMGGLLTALNVLPPGAAMAGIYARTDMTHGVFKAPANTPVMSVLSPTVAISADDQEDLNVPLDGHAVNAIRTFTGRGVLVCGARTLDGNALDLRYINVRRTLIMLEQLVLYAAKAYVFEPNEAGTWKAVQTMIGHFLDNQWKAGALAGATPADAYSVSVGPDSTMPAATASTAICA